MIVSDVAGTTRDAVDTEIIHKAASPTCLLIPQACGARTRSRRTLERYSIIRTVSAVERADIVVVVIDAAEGITEQDAKIAGIAHERGKGVIVAVNKWDAVVKNDKTIYEYTNKLKEVLSFMPYAEYLFISALTGQRMGKLFRPDRRGAPESEPAGFHRRFK